MGTGLGSSGTCAVGLLNALWAFKGQPKTTKELAEQAFEITQNLGFPDGKQDPYLAAVGGILAMDIDTDDSVLLMKPSMKHSTLNNFVDNSLLVYTGVNRESKKVLENQNNDVKHRMKEIGQKIYNAFNRDDLSAFGALMNEHWELKKKTSPHVSNPDFDKIHSLAMRSGCLGGKLVGAGGGGYFLFYCGNKEIKDRTIQVLKAEGLKEIPFAIDYQGTRVKEIEI